MTPGTLARRYLDAFCAADFTALQDVLAEDLAFDGPFLRTTSAGAYLDVLRADPPVGCSYELIAAFETASNACLVFTFLRPGLQVPMAGYFEVHAGRITRILLMFDTAPFT